MIGTEYEKRRSDMNRFLSAYLSDEDGDRLAETVADYIRTRGLWISPEARRLLVEAIDDENSVALT